MRARMAITYAKVQVELREILLKDKPQAMIDVSAKGTVPVLVVSSSQIIDESLDVMKWVLTKHDPHRWYFGQEPSIQRLTDQLIVRNDIEFKPQLDQYKYAARFPEHSEQSYREKAMPFLAHLEQLLQKHQFLLSDQITLADIAIFPFIRQFAFVDKDWFDSTSYIYLKQWLAYWLDSDLFNGVMKKYQPWQPGDKTTYFPHDIYPFYLKMHDSASQ